ncbi:hypothetical protein [Paraburkholderia sp. J41]|uniref:hypothetical protein n=1 Tax=Paraburkholderia sp. J41 TaxID=2805433 RepID=UPI002AC33F71|nr:hypothetical protein [Paraburkholderia sp. J41]
MAAVLPTAALPQTLAAPAFRSKPTEPIIGSAAHEWNRFSIFIRHEIFIARGTPLSYSCS